jgi:hypothetical protein
LQERAALSHIAAIIEVKDSPSVVPRLLGKQEEYSIGDIYSLDWGGY